LELSVGGTVNPRNQSFVVTLLLIIAAVAMVVMAIQRESGSQESLTINEVARDIKAGKIARIVIEDTDTLRVIYNDGDVDGVEAYKETDATLVAQLQALGVSAEQLSPENVSIEVKPPSQWAGIVSGAL
jgi:cell division protease FtsH